MEEHIRKLRGLQQTLHMIGELLVISDQDFSNTLLTSLPKSWSTFIMAVNASLQIADTDIRCPDCTDLGGIQIPTSWLRGHGAYIKEPSRTKSLNCSAAQKESVAIVAKRATGSRISGSQGQTKKVKPPNGGNFRTRPNKCKKSLLTMISHLQVQKHVPQQSLQVIG